VDAWEIDLDAEVRVGDFIDRLRALTFPPYDNAYFEKDGEKYHVDIEIRKEGDADNDGAEAEEKNVPVYNEDDY
jgi:methionyl-tRNA formyltransferase